MNKTRVVHCKRDDYDVYIGRGKCPKTGKYGIWGNPFSYKEGTIAKYKVNTLEESVSSFEKWIITQPQLLSRLHELKGKTLGCWCKKKYIKGVEDNTLCHGDVLVKLANKVE